ncbi:TonB-dependent receptor [Ramlibacter tataouinensis]|nr:TonB-dependent receptor [Ramlibacter tataouinensis]
MCVGHQAFAQQASPAPSSVALDAVTVTTNKRPQLQREVAGSVSTVDGADLENRGSKDQEDVFKLTPGVQFTKGEPTTSSVTIRGIGTSNCAICGGVVQGTTGFYLEDVPLTDPYGSSSVLDLYPFDLDRIEVLRGPQGALYGSSSLGGAVRYLVAKPNLKAMEASVLVNGTQVSGGSAGYSAFAMLNTPLGDSSAAARFVVFDRKDGGYVDNLGTGKTDANELRQRGGRVGVTVKPTRDLSITGMLLTQEVKTGDTSAVSPDPTKLEISTPTATTLKSRLDFGNLQADYDLGPVMLTSITGFWRKEGDLHYDSTRIYQDLGTGFGLPRLPVVVAPTITTYRAGSEEFRVSSNQPGPLSFVAGAFYQRTEYRADGSILAPGGTALWGALGTILIPNDTIGVTNGSAETSEKALFADGEYSFGNGWSAGLGARWYRTTVASDLSLTLLGMPSAATGSTSESGTTPKATIKYRFGDNLWYALYSEGYRFGGVNPVGTFKPFNSDSLKNYETGVRLAPAKNLLLDVTAFYMDWSDAQVNSFDTSGPIPLSIVANVGKATNKGLEVALDYRATGSLRLNAAVAYTDAKTAADFPSGAVPGAIVPTGSRLPGTPHFQSVLSANYSFDGPWESRATAFATHSYVGSRTMDIDGIRSAPGYGTLDVGIRFVRDNWTLGLNLANVFNERGIVGLFGGVPGVPYTDYYLQRPRTFTASLRWDM